MVVTLGRRAARSQVPSPARAATAAELEAVLVSPARWEDPAGERGRLVGHLVELAAGDREPLEQLRSKLLERMHSPDRSGVAAQLPLVEAALSLIPRAVEERWRWIQRVGERRPRRWRR